MNLRAARGTRDVLPPEVDRWQRVESAARRTFALYGMTACRTIYGGDSAEFSIVFATWSVAHPPGYPLFSLIGSLAPQLA